MKDRMDTTSRILVRSERLVNRKLRGKQEDTSRDITYIRTALGSDILAREKGFPPRKPNGARKPSQPSQCRFWGEERRDAFLAMTVEGWNLEGSDEWANARRVVVIDKTTSTSTGRY